MERQGATFIIGGLQMKQYWDQANVVHVFGYERNKFFFSFLLVFVLFSLFFPFIYGNTKQDRIYQ